MRLSCLSAVALAFVFAAAGCLTQTKRNEIFSDGIQDAFIETKMAEQYLAYVAADPALGADVKAKRTGWVARVKELLDAHGDNVTAAVKLHMLTNGICAQYDAYIDADPKLKETSKYIRKRSSMQIRKLIATAEGGSP